LSADIEEMTSKTGNVKKYPVFCRMLSNAVQRTSDSVFVDLLTMADLEMLRARRMQQQQQLNTSSDHISLSASKEGVLPSSSATSATKSDKRFLILTYLVEFDRFVFLLSCVCPSSSSFFI
jgi:coiled-coil domain-containing protein 61